jgi:hypothetical protein
MGRSGKFHSHFPGCTVKKADEQQVLETTALADRSIEARYNELERASIYRLDPVYDKEGNIVGWG